MGLLFNYGCYIFIDNQTKATLTLSKSDSEWGTWALPPPPTIAPGERVRIELDDTAGPTGSEGVIEYNYPTASQPAAITLHFACPTASTNYVEVTVPSWSPYLRATFTAKSGSDVKEPIETGNWGSENSCPSFGHPLAINVIIQST